jgi:hypothetical protein
MNKNNSLLDGLYHQALGIPAEFLEAVSKTFTLFYGPHTRRALVDDRYLSRAVAEGREAHPGRFNAPDLLPRVVTVMPESVIELEVADEVPIKVVARVSATPHFDLVLTFKPRPDPAFVITLWLNEKNDRHLTLNTAAYRKP